MPVKINKETPTQRSLFFLSCDQINKPCQSVVQRPLHVYCLTSLSTAPGKPANRRV
jgi:hypothetical protein